MIPVKVISSSDLEENGGVYLVKKGIPATPVHGFTTQGNRVVSSKAMPVYVVSDAEFNAGDFVKGRGQPVKVGDIDDLGFVGVVEGREAIPVYAVNDWPPSDDVPLDPDYLVYEGAMAVAPSAANQLFISWKAALGVDVLADAMDIAYILAAETEQAALLNMVKRAHDATNVNAVAFEASRGFTGNGSTSYLNTNYNANTQGVKFTLNNASLGVYSRTDLANNIMTEFAASGESGLPGTRITLRTATDVIVIQLNSNTGPNIGTNPNSLGLHVINRSNNTQIIAYKNGLNFLEPGAANSVSIPAVNMYICARNTNGTASLFSTRQIAFGFMGQALTGGKHLATYNAWQTFLTAIGAQV